MPTDPRIVTLGIDGQWMPMDVARLMHLVVRYYRLEQLVHLAMTGRRNFFDDRLNAVILKYLAAFDWIAAPLMSGKYNQSYTESEDFVRDFGVSDLRVHSMRYPSPGHIAFLGIGPIMEGLHGVFDTIRQIKEPSRFVEGDSADMFADIDAGLRLLGCRTTCHRLALDRGPALHLERHDPGPDRHGGEKRRNALDTPSRVSRRTTDGRV